MIHAQAFRYVMIAGFLLALSACSLVPSGTDWDHMDYAALLKESAKNNTQAMAFAREK